MFEKYPLIHVEVKKPLTNRNDDLYASSIQVSGEAPMHTDPGPGATEADDPLDYRTELRRTEFRLSGSFDYLPLFSPGKESQSPFREKLFLKGFTIMKNTHDYYIRRRSLDTLILSYTLEGEGELVLGEQSYVTGPGKGFIIDGRKPHYYHTVGEHWKHIDIQIWGTEADGIYQCFSKFGIVTFTYLQSAYFHLIEKLLDACTYYSECQGLYISNALSDLLCSVLKQSEKEGASSIPLFYRYIIRYIESNYMRKLSLQDLSELFHISKYHLCREYRKYTGNTPVEHIVDLRVRHACLLLAQSNMPIAEVALESGFENMSYFISQIKKRTGMTPSALRNTFQA